MFCIPSVYLYVYIVHLNMDHVEHLGQKVRIFSLCVIAQVLHPLNNQRSQNQPVSENQRRKTINPFLPPDKWFFLCRAVNIN